MKSETERTEGGRQGGLELALTVGPSARENNFAGAVITNSKTTFTPEQAAAGERKKRLEHNLAYINTVADTMVCARYYIWDLRAAGSYGTSTLFEVDPVVGKKYSGNFTVYRGNDDGFGKAIHAMTRVADFVGFPLMEHMPDLYELAAGYKKQLITDPAKSELRMEYAFSMEDSTNPAFYLSIQCSTGNIGKIAIDEGPLTVRSFGNNTIKLTLEPNKDNPISPMRAASGRYSFPTGPDGSA